MKSCTFIGHRKIEINNTLIDNLTSVVEKLINEENVLRFYFGSKSEFNTLCYDVVTNLKTKYTNIQRVYVRAEYNYKKADEIYLEDFEDTYYPDKIKNSGRYAYVERNQIMIDNSDHCIFYYKEDYKTDVNKKLGFAEVPTKSGTKLALDYAKKSKKNILIINK